MEEFLKINRDFWSKYRLKTGGPKLLIEEMGLPMILHMNAWFGNLLNLAKGLEPVWLNGEKYDATLVKSYFPAGEPINEVGPGWWFKIYAMLVAALKFPKIALTGNILDFYFDGVKYGDIVYDSYLYTHKVSTIRKIRLNLIKQMALCVHRHVKLKAILKSENFVGVLVSHQVGIRSGVLLRVALRYGYHGYFRFGTVLCDYQKLEEVYDYPLKPTAAEIDLIVNTLGDKLEPVFQEVLNKHVSGQSTKDGLHAFAKSNKYYTDRQKFNADFGLPPEQKNIFIMLHAFIDSPHSHFKWMIFKDYYDWFYQTLQFAKKHPEFNWIFKQHPSAKYYQTGDVDFNELFKGCGKNIIYIDDDNQLDTRSLIDCADVVVTCLGSAGFEIPAMGGVPSVTAADNFYTGLGFAVEPKNKEEYFKILSQADKMEKLSAAALNRAKATFIYIRDYAIYNISSFIKLSFSEEKDRDIKSWYWTKVSAAYQANHQAISQEIDYCVKKISQPDFKKLTGLEELLKR